MKKKLMLTIMLMLALAIAIPANILADSDGTVTADLYVVAVDRTFKEVELENVGLKQEGSVTYMGVVLPTATMDGEPWYEVMGASVMATESFEYLLDPYTGNVIDGRVEGRLNLVQGDSGGMSIKFEATVWGNLVNGPAFDAGIWEVMEAWGAFAGLEAEGDWTAQVGFIEVPGNGGTFAGTVSMMGAYEMHTTMVGG